MICKSNPIWRYIMVLKLIFLTVSDSIMLYDIYMGDRYWLHILVAALLSSIIVLAVTEHIMRK